MSKVSKSPDRHSFQKGGYVKRQEEAGEAVSEAYLDMFENIINAHEHKFDDPASHINNMEYDLLTTDWMLDKIRTNNSYAQNLYAAMCNRQFQKLDVIPVLKDERWSCSWRYAGGIIADMQQKGDYIDWYCSGIQGMDDDQFQDLDAEAKERYLYMKNNYVGEGVVTDQIREDLFKLGWIVLDAE